MSERGFSLIEMVVVLALIGILATIATLNFNTYIRRSNKESQTRTLYTELMQARLCSLTERRARYVKLKPAAFEVYSSKVDDAAGAAPKVSVPLKYRITWSDNLQRLEIDDRGIVNFSEQGSMCIVDNSDKGVTDSVVVSLTRVNLGSRQSGKECKSDFIDVK